MNDQCQSSEVSSKFKMNDGGRFVKPYATSNISRGPIGVRLDSNNNLLVKVDENQWLPASSIPEQRLRLILNYVGTKATAHISTMSHGCMFGARSQPLPESKVKTQSKSIIKTTAKKKLEAEKKMNLRNEENRVKALELEKRIKNTQKRKEKELRIERKRLQKEKQTIDEEMKKSFSPEFPSEIELPLNPLPYDPSADVVDEDDDYVKNIKQKQSKSKRHFSIEIPKQKPSSDIEAIFRAILAEDRKQPDKWPLHEPSPIEDSLINISEALEHTDFPDSALLRRTKAPEITESSSEDDSSRSFPEILRNTGFADACAKKSGQPSSDAEEE